MEKLKYAAQTAEQWYGEEIRLYAQIYQQVKSHEDVKEQFFQQNLLNEVRQSSAERRFNRFARRAKLLGDEGLRLLNTATIEDADALILMSYLKAYRFSFEFVFEYLINKYNDSEPIVYAAEIDQFYERKHSHFPNELDWSYESRKRMKSQLIKMLLNGQLIGKNSSENYTLQKLLLSEDVHDFFLNNRPFDTIVL